MGEKPFKTFRSQLGILRKRGMIVPTNGRPIRILESENYYNVINGYKDLFIETIGTSSTEEKYKVGTHFNEVYALYKFDCELKIIFLKRLLRIETKIKTSIAYNFSEKYASNKNAKNCIVMENFDLTNLRKNEKYEDRYCTVMNMITKIQNEIARQLRSNDSIKHYMLNYGYVPLWVLMNVLPFGSVSLFYRYMKQSDKQQIAKKYKITEKELEVILKVLSLVRNLCAHDERLYNFKPSNYIKGNWVHAKLKIPSGVNGPIDGRKDLFAILICIRLLINKTEMKKMVTEITKEINLLDKELKVIHIEDVLKQMGFPSYWQDIATI